MEYSTGEYLGSGTDYELSGSGPIWMNSSCNGNEDNIFQCGRYDGEFEYSCVHGEDTIIRCTGNCLDDGNCQSI